MPVINNSQDLKTCVGGAVNNSVMWDHISYTQDHVILEVFEPLLGSAVVALLEGAPFNSDKSSHLYWLQRAMGRLMMYEYAKSPIQMTGSGAKQTVAENATPVYKYQEVAYRNNMLRTGYNFLERGMYLMAKNQLAGYITGNPVFSDYNRWIPYASDLSKISGLSVSRYDYERIISSLDDISRIIIGKIIPDSSRLLLVKAKITTNVSPPLLELIQRAVGNLGIKEAVSRGWVTIHEGNVVVKEMSVFNSPGENLQGGNSEGISLKMRAHELWGSLYIREIIDYIIAHKDDDGITPIYTHYMSGQPESSTDETCPSTCSERGEFCHRKHNNGIVSI